MLSNVPTSDAALHIAHYLATRQLLPIAKNKIKYETKALETVLPSDWHHQI